VKAIRRAGDGKMAKLVRERDPESEPETATRAADDLVVVAEFRDPIYPGLVSTGKVARGGDKPFHTVSCLFSLPLGFLWGGSCSLAQSALARLAMIGTDVFQPDLLEDEDAENRGRSRNP
jgi:hypothetical protein